MTRADTCAAGIHERFVECARLGPERVAIAMPGEREITYAELDYRSDLLADRLGAVGVQRGEVVGLHVRRSAEAVIGILGILKAGGAYVPVDPDYPDARVRYLFEDSAVAVVVADTATAPQVGAERVVVPVDGPLPPAGPSLRRPSPTAGAELAYVIYTSGSTGPPKGVAVEHRQVLRLFEATRDDLRFSPDDRWCLFHSLSFDFSVWELWGALLHGGCLVLLSKTAARTSATLIDLLVAGGITVLNQTPSAFQQLQTALLKRRAQLPALRLVVFGGERLDVRLLERWIARFGDDAPRLVNMYGITETTVHVTRRRVTVADLDAAGGSSPIGDALPDLQVHLLDERGEPVPDGVPGEIYVAGAGLARGYLGRPALTAERFVAARSGGGLRWYRSGDRAVRREGELVYLGRTDDQLAVRGFRIEPGEIEECLGRMPSVARAVITPRLFAAGDVRLVAHVLPTNPVEPGSAAAQSLATAAAAHVRTHLPRHLRPFRFVVVDDFPMTAQGKVDRDALVV